jgi:catechol 2,3-dioxygenase-like lactoylglutathione lyase family enzyme
MKPTYFDFTVRDLARAKTFFEQVLGWRFERFEMPYEYYRIQAGPEGEAGIDGGIGGIEDSPTSEGRSMTQIWTMSSPGSSPPAGKSLRPECPFRASVGMRPVPSQVVSNSDSSRQTRAQGSPERRRTTLT